MVTTRSMTFRARYDAQFRQPHREDSSLKRPQTGISYSAGRSQPQCPGSRNVTLQQCKENESYLTKLKRTGVIATPVDWLPDIIRSDCEIVMERYEQHVSELDDSIDLDRVRRAFVLVKAQARTLATLFVPAIREFLLPELEGSRQAILKELQDLDIAAGGIDDKARAVEVMEKVDTTIMFFKDLIEDVIDHCKIVT